MIKENLNNSIETDFDGIQESLECIQKSVNDLYGALSKIRYTIWLKEKIDREKF